MDWGVDIELAALERVRGATLLERGPHVELVVATGSGSMRCILPSELAQEAGLCTRLLERFVPTAGTILPRRRYAVDDLGFDARSAALFGQVGVGEAMLARLQQAESLVAVLFSPARAGQRDPAMIALTSTHLVSCRAGEICKLPLRQVGLVRLVLSPLVGRLEIRSAGAAMTVSYPAPLFGQGTEFARRLRRAWANASGPDDGPLADLPASR